jgi:hypothetical protein
MHAPGYVRPAGRKGVSFIQDVRVAKVNDQVVDQAAILCIRYAASIVNFREQELQHFEWDCLVGVQVLSHLCQRNRKVPVCEVIPAAMCKPLVSILLQTSVGILIQVGMVSAEEKWKYSITWSTHRIFHPREPNFRRSWTTA